MVIEYLRKHLAHRELDIRRYSGVWIDDEDEVVTFPLWNLSGQMVGYQKYRPWGTKSTTNPYDSKYFPIISEGQIGVFGVETLSYRPDVIILAEGVFDICKVHNCELPGVAVLGNNPLHLTSWLKALGRKIITIPDADKPGQSLVSFGHQNIDISSYFPSVNKGSVDLGRMSSQQVKDLLKYI